MSVLGIVLYASNFVLFALCALFFFECFFVCFLLFIKKKNENEK